MAKWRGEKLYIDGRKLKKVRGSTASYSMGPGNGSETDLDELAKVYASNIGHVPTHVGWAKACEIHLLAKAYLTLRKRFDSRKKAGK